MSSDPDPPSPINRVDLREAVAAELRALILDGRFAPGQRLIETELATRFGTSRGPVRDALAILERTGLVQVVARAGSFVAQLSAEDVDELYSLRTALEELAVRRAVARATDADLARIRAALDELAHTTGHDDPRAIATADIRFHRAIVEAAAHGRLRAAWEAVADQTLLVMRELPAVRPEVQSAVGRHLDIADAIETRDEASAVAAIREHLADAGEAIVLDRTQNGPPTVR